MQRLIASLLLTNLTTTITALPIRAHISGSTLNHTTNRAEQITPADRKDEQRIVQKAECNSEYVIVSTPNGGALSWIVNCLL